MDGWMVGRDGWINGWMDGGRRRRRNGIMR
jgi:hypothetical protein